MKLCVVVWLQLKFLHWHLRDGQSKIWPNLRNLIKLKIKIKKNILYILNSKLFEKNMGKFEVLFLFEFLSGSKRKPLICPFFWNFLNFCAQLGQINLYSLGIQIKNLPNKAAWWSGLWPCLSTALTFAPLAINNFATFSVSA